jgi:tRNA A-37 threonylcarbamoyl transferase component Bud32/dipeptidyl aminopeptidase/acylaminoacyl peptidase
MTTSLQRLSAALADRYRVEQEIGQGGMATVYLAEDLKHGRRVALKVLHPELAAVLGGERFLAEIKTTAHLQHPNILQLFDSGAADGLLYYVMPFVEGESLRGRLTREKQLPVDDAIAIARGVSAALDFAHRRGVIHRDIKPENILLQDGQPLVADFGIALAVKQAGGARLTQTGLSLGTPQYMSPEQATAERELDARSDIYAVGAVTYEMLGGEPPFTGTSTQAIIAKLMTEEPRRLSVLRKTVPPHVEAAVHRAMEKLPADRFGSAAEFAAALADGTRTVRLPSGALAAVQPSPRRAAGLAVAAVAIAGLSLLLGRWTAPEPESGPAPSRLAILPPQQGSVVSAGLARIVDISQDGKLVAFAANGPASDFVALRRLDEPSATAMPNSAGIRNLRITPDGQHILSPRSTVNLQRAPIAAGTWSPLPAVATTAFLAWASDGSIWWTPMLGGGMYRTRPGATTSEAPFAADSVGGGPVIQQILPGDRKALVVMSAASNSGLAGVRDLQTGAVTNLFDFPIVELRYTAGVLVYARPDNTLSAVSFDPDKGVVTGAPLVLTDDVALTGAGVAQFAVSGNGTVVYLPSFGRELVEVPRSGGGRRLTEERLNYHSPKFSPDGRLIALDNTGADGRDIWVFNREQQQLSRSTFDRDGHDPVWSLDGKTIYYLSQKSGQLGIYRVRPGGGKSDSVFVHRLIAYTGVPIGTGDTLVTVGTDMNGRSGTDIALIHIGPPGRIEPLFATPFDEGWVLPSPDGKWIAFSSDESGRQEVYVHPMSLEGLKVQVSIDGGSEPVWARNGRELFYRRPTGGAAHLVVAELSLSPEARVLKRTTLFDASEYEPSQPHASYDVAPDGQSFVMLRRSPATHIVVIQNVQELVRRAQGPR